MKRSRKTVSINRVIDWFIINNNQITLFTYCTVPSYPKQELLKPGIIFYCVQFSN